MGNSTAHRGTGRRPGRPSMGPHTKRLVQVPQDLDEAMKAEAEAAGLSISEYMRRSLREYLARHQAEQGEPAA